MARPSHDNSAWRVLRVALGAFAIAVHLLLSGWLIVQSPGNPVSSSQEGLAVICTHETAATFDDTGDPLEPHTPHQHSQCLACACPHWPKLLAPLPMPPVFVVLRPSSQTLHAFVSLAATEPRSPSPYPSRAPPVSA